MRAGGGGRDACSISASFLFSRANGTEEPLEKLASPPRHSPFSWANRADKVAQTDFSALSWPWFIPAGGDDGAGEAFPRALAMPVTHTLGLLQPKPRSSAPENAVRCMCSCSALHLPSQRAAYAHAARCVCPCSAVRFFVLPWVGSSGSAFRPRTDAAASLLGVYSDDLGSRLWWGMARGKGFPAIV